MQYLRASLFIAGLAVLALAWSPNPATAADVDDLLRLGDWLAGEPAVDEEPLMAYA